MADRSREGLLLRFPLLFSFIWLAVCLLVVVSDFAIASPPSANLLLPDRVGSFRRLPQTSQPTKLEELTDQQGRNDAEVQHQPSAAVAEYVSADGNGFLVDFLQFKRDSDAYSFLTVFAKHRRETAPDSVQYEETIGRASYLIPGGVAFFRGTFFVKVSSAQPGEKKSGGELLSFSRLLAEQIDKGEGDIPVLVKHLPAWQEAQRRAVYLNGFTSLNKAVGGQPVLEAIDSAGDADAVATSYGQSQLLLVEFNTPQLAADNDRRILAKIQELKNQGLASPTAYRRVGNYAVFVFKGDNEQTANQLIDQIKYEQVVQWLGDNPYLLQEAQRRYTETTLGVFLSVVKASGLALVLCFGVGGLFGTLLFVHRRAQQRTLRAFSDAGGMMRLNIDEMTPQTDAGRLIDSGDWKA